MNILAFIKAVFKNHHTQQPIICANCWGVQEYDHTIHNPRYDRRLDIVNHRKKWSFVERFIRS